MQRNWLIVGLVILYVSNLGSAGFLGPDEPRYASVAREMARSGDWITPRLDGRPWFEKPPLLYWMTALGRRLHLPDEWAARLPVALESVAFLIFFYGALVREFSPRVAFTATTILATSAGWLAYSFAAVPDLPMSAALDAAMVIAVFDTRRRQGYVAGVLLGLSVLAKAFVPLILIVPALFVARGKRWRMAAGCLAVAAPWYLLCTFRNGEMFWREFFWAQQVARFFTPALQHVQPFWYYLPVLLAGLFPWTPLAGLLARRKTYDDVRVRFFVLWLVYAALFFSIARNKLPGYALPMLPALAIVLAVGLDKAAAYAKWWLASSMLALLVLPAVVRVLPDALLAGITKAPINFFPALPFVLAAAAVWWLDWKEKPFLAVATAAAAAALAVMYVRVAALPVLDRRVSVRQFWRANRQQVGGACFENVSREWEYGLNYYAARPLPECGSGGGPRIRGNGGELALERQP